jgi:tetratricopeptide (TPR) repeat protein
MVRVLMLPENKGVEDNLIVSVLEDAKSKFPEDYELHISEFNFWFSKNNNLKAQKALKNAIDSNPLDKQLHFNIGVIFDNLATKQFESKNIDSAYAYIEKSINGYKKAIEIDSNYVDAYYNLGALFVNESRAIQNLANSLEGKEYDEGMKLAKLTIKKGIPYLEKVLKYSPENKDTLTVLKSIYANINDEVNYSRIKKQLESL